MAMAFSGGRSRRPELDLLASLYGTGNPAADMVQAMPPSAAPMQAGIAPMPAGVAPVPAMAGAIPPAPAGASSTGTPSYMSNPRPSGMFGGSAPRRAPLGIEAQPAPFAPDIANAQPLDVQTPKIRPHFFDQQGIGTKILKGVGEVALQYSASQGNQGALMTLQQRMRAQQDASEDERWQRRHDLDRDETLSDRAVAAAMPQYFAGGQDRVRFDPTTGQTQTVYDAPMPAESYASNFGAPGSDGYKNALQSYTLRGWSDDALDNRSALEDVRFKNRASLRSQPTYRDAHPKAPAPRAAPQVTPNNVLGGILQKAASGGKLSAPEQDLYNTWKNGRQRAPTGRGGGGMAAAAPVRVNTPADAQKLPSGTMFIGADGVTRIRP